MVILVCCGYFGLLSCSCCGLLSVVGVVVRCGCCGQLCCICCGPFWFVMLRLFWSVVLLL